MESNGPPAVPEPSERITDLIRILRLAEEELKQSSGATPDAIQGVMEKITKVSSALQSLQVTDSSTRALAEKQWLILNALPAHIALLDANGDIEAVNQSWKDYASFGAPQGTNFVVGHNYISECEIARGDGSEPARAVAAGARRVLRQEIKTFSLDYSCLNREEKCWYRLMVTRLSAAKGNGAMVIRTNITERRMAEESARQLSQAVEQSPVSIMITDQSGAIQYINPKFAQVTGYSREEIKGKNPNLLKGGETTRETYLELWNTIKNGGTWRGELHNRKKNGDLFWELASISPVIDADGRICNFLAVKEDITDRKIAQDAAACALREKEVLLREIHHRVKNNLQVISSLLAMQSETHIDDSSRYLLREAENRVRSMAMIHEKLYQSDNLAQVDFGEYVNGLSVFLFRCYSTAADRVQLKVSAGDIRLNIDTASPCGLLLNELISNALKHAFPAGRSGEVRVDLRSEAEGYSLTVADNGVGLPADFDLKKTESLGMQLIDTLARQLKGKLTIHREGGCGFRLDFKEMIYASRS